MKSSTGLKVTALALPGLGIASVAPAFAEPITIRFGFAQVGVGNRQFGSGSPAAIVHEKFGRLFGELVPHLTVPSLQGTENMLGIDGRSLILGHFAQKVLGFGSSDSGRLLAIFQDYITRPENTVRWQWAAGDVAVWDNRSTQHRAVDDYGDQPRVVRRVTIAGEPPVGVDGRRSVTRSRIPAASAA